MFKINFIDELKTKKIIVMKKLRKLELKKSTITSLENNEQKNLKGGFSSGCSDGCLTAIMHTVLINCSNTGCTRDCGNCGYR